MGNNDESKIKRSGETRLERTLDSLERPSLDEQKLQEMSKTLSLAMLDSKLVTLTLLTPYTLDTQTILPKSIDISTRTINGYSGVAERNVRIPLKYVMDVNLDKVDYYGQE